MGRAEWWWFSGFGVDLRVGSAEGVDVVRWGAGTKAVVVAALVGPCVVGRADVPEYDFNWAYVHNEGNAPISSAGDNFGRGSVGYGYRISKLEITTQWRCAVGTIGCAW